MHDGKHAYGCQAGDKPAAVQLAQWQKALTHWLFPHLTTTTITLTMALGVCGQKCPS